MPRSGGAFLAVLIVLLWGWTIVTALLVFSSLTQQELLFCGPKSGCDAVLKGKYSSLLGIPLAIWGFGSALLLFALLVVSLISSRRALLAMRVFGILCLIFTLASGFFVFLQMGVLHQKCAYCLASGVLVAAIFIVGGVVGDRVKAGWKPQLSGRASLTLAVVPPLGALAFLGVGLFLRRPGNSADPVILQIGRVTYTESQWRNECAPQLDPVSQMTIKIEEEWMQKKLFEYVLESVAADRGKTAKETEAEVRSKIKIPEEDLQSAPAERREALRIELAEKLYRDELSKLLDPKKKPTMRSMFKRSAPRVVKLDTEGAQALGPKGAPVEVIIISDFECPFCLSTASYADELRKNFGDRVRIVAMHNPLATHKNAKLAAIANECAATFGKYWEYRKLLYEKSPRLDRESLLSYAQSLGIDPAAFAAELDSGRATRLVERQVRDISSHLNGVPVFIINGKVNIGGVSIDKIDAAVREALKESGK